MRRLHKVPLSDQALALFETLDEMTGDRKLLFPSVRSAERSMSDNTLNAALRRLGYAQDEMTAHGFRAMAAKDKLPDYSAILREMGARLDRIEEQLRSINEKPAMLLTPLTIATEMHEGTTVYRAEDRKTVGEAREALARSLGRVEGMMKLSRSNKEQDWWVTWAATGGILGGALLALIGVAAWS